MFSHKLCRVYQSVFKKTTTFVQIYKISNLIIGYQYQIYHLVNKSMEVLLIINKSFFHMINLILYDGMHIQKNVLKLFFMYYIENILKSCKLLYCLLGETGTVWTVIFLSQCRRIVMIQVKL